MNPIQMAIRGYKTAVSNLGLAWVYLGSILLLGMLTVLPIVLVVAVVGTAALSGDWSHSWSLWVGVGLVFCGWVSLLLIAWFYVEGGLRGLVARAHRSAPADFSLKPRVGISDAFRVFTFSAFVEEVKRHGWRVTVIASLYGLAGSFLLIPCMVPLLVALPSVVAQEPGALAAVMVVLFLILLILTIIVLIALSLHYQVAVTFAVLNEAGLRVSVREATRQIKAKPIELLALFGMSLAGGMVVGVAFTIVSIPLAILTMIPGVGLAMIPLRLILMVVQWFVQGILQSAVIGAMTAYCAPLALDAPAAPPARSAGEPSPPQAEPPPPIVPA